MRISPIRKIGKNRKIYRKRRPGEDLNSFEINRDGMAAIIRKRFTVTPIMRAIQGICGTDDHAYMNILMGNKMPATQGR